MKDLTVIIPLVEYKDEHLNFFNRSVNSIISADTSAEVSVIFIGPSSAIKEIKNNFEQAMSDDFNTPLAIAEFRKVSIPGSPYITKSFEQVHFNALIFHKRFIRPIFLQRITVFIILIAKNTIHMLLIKGFGVMMKKTLQNVSKNLKKIVKN